MIVPWSVRIYDPDNGGSLIPHQDVVVPGPVLGVDPKLHLDRTAAAKLWCHNSSPRSVGVYFAMSGTELPLNLDLALIHGQARWLGVVDGIHILLGPRAGELVGL